MAEFHRQLQEVTNFPLRPFVLPFLHTNIPLLQRDIARYIAFPFFPLFLMDRYFKGNIPQDSRSCMKTYGWKFRYRYGACVMYFCILNLDLSILIGVGTLRLLRLM